MMMLLCSDSQNEFEKGQICVRCSRLFCSTDETMQCPFCGGSLESLKVNTQSLDTVQVQWLVYKNSASLGVVGLEKLPSYVALVMKKLEAFNKKLRIVLFPSKAASVEYERIILKKRGIPVKKEVFSAGSRYTLFFPESAEPGYVLLNIEAIEENTVFFLLELVSRMLCKAEAYRETWNTLHAQLVGTFAEVFFSYARKMAIPFVYADETTKEFISLMVRNIQNNYIECLVLRGLINERTMLDALANYLEYKIALSLETLDYEMRFSLVEVYQILERMLLIATLMSAISDHKLLSQSLSNSFEKHNEEFTRKYSELPDLLRAVELLFANKERIEFSSYDRYVKSVVEVIQPAFSEIEARYVSLGESVVLLSLSDYYLDALENGHLAYVPRIGSVNDYFKLLEKVFNKPGIYPEVRIIAGMALRETLLAMVLMSHNQGLFSRLVECSKKFCRLVEESLPEVLKKNGPLPGFAGSSITYEDAAEELLAVASVARSYGDYVAEKELWNMAENVASKHDLPSIKVHLSWARFVDSQDFGTLFKIHEMINDIDFVRFPHLRNIILPIDLLVQALLYRNDVESLIGRAQDLVLEGSDAGTTHSVYLSKSNQTLQAMFLMLDVFKWLLTSIRSKNELRKAYISSLALREILAKKDRLHIIALKTEILYKVIEQDFETAAKLYENLSVYPDPLGRIGSYLKSVSRWIEICAIEAERRYVYQKEFHYNGNDIWIEMLFSHIRESMEDDLSRSIVASKAVVFVEGVTDVVILEEFARKLCPETKISFIDLEGYTNYQYYVEAKITKETRVPCYLILDGDVSRKDKDDLIRRFAGLSISENAVIVLQKNSIEDYLLVPDAIKKAFPRLNLNTQNIENFLVKNRRKKNSKYLLQSLLKEGSLGPYDKASAKRIAQKIEKDEIDAELVEKLKIVATRKVHDISRGSKGL